jgi:ketosteroid isomerase-like protein
MMTYEDAEAHAQSWISAWNAHDLNNILLHYSQDVVFEAETVKRRWNKPTLHGIEELRKHFALGLELAPGMTFHLEQVFLAPSGYAILYRRENGNRVIDCVKVDDSGRATNVVAYYASVQK